MAINPYGQSLPGEEWLKKLQNGGRLVGSVPLLEATGQFTERLKAPGGAPTPPKPAANRPSLMSAISSLRPGQSESPNPLAPGGYSGIPSVEEYRQLPDPRIQRDRTDVSETGGGIGGYLGGPGVGNAMIGAGGAMLEAAGQSGATFGGSLGTGLKNFAAERASYAESEMARSRSSQTADRDRDERLSSIRSLLRTRGITDPAMVDEYLARAGTEYGYRAVLDELAPKAADDSGDQLATSLEETAALVALSAEVAALEAIPAGQRTPEQVADLVAGRRDLQYMERATDTDDPVPPTPPSPSTVQKDLDFIAQTQGYADAQAAQRAWGTDGRGDWARIHMAQIRGQSQPTQYRGRTPSRGQIAAETRRIAAYDEWFIEGRGAQFEKNLDTFDEVMFELDERVAAQDLQGSSDWDNDQNTGFAQALRGALVSKMPFMASAQLPGDANTLDLVRAVVFQSLKETLGGQFAEREAENLVRAAYNPMLSPSVNKRRIQRLMNELRSTDHYMESMKDYYESTGELAFYTHQSAEEAWNLATEAGEVEGLGSSTINPLEYTGLEGNELTEAMQFDLDSLTSAQREALAYKLSGGRPYANLEGTLDPLAFKMYLAIREMGR